WSLVRGWGRGWNETLFAVVEARREVQTIEVGVRQGPAGRVERVDDSVTGGELHDAGSAHRAGDVDHDAPPGTASRGGRRRGAARRRGRWRRNRRRGRPIRDQCCGDGEDRGDREHRGAVAASTEGPGPGAQTRAVWAAAADRPILRTPEAGIGGKSVVALVGRGRGAGRIGSGHGDLRGHRAVGGSAGERNGWSRYRRSATVSAHDEVDKPPGN